MVTTTSVNSGLLWSSCCCYHVDRQLLNKVSLWTKMCVKFRWFTSHCKVLGEELLYITNLGWLKMSWLGRTFYKLQVEQEVDTLYIWLKTKTPRKKLASQSRENFRDKRKKAQNPREGESSSQRNHGIGKKAKDLYKSVGTTYTIKLKNSRYQRKALPDLDEQQRNVAWFK